MFHNPMLRRLATRLWHSRGVDAASTAGAGIGAGPGTSPAPMPAPVVAPALDGTPSPGRPADPALQSCEFHHARGLRLVEAHRWNWAQRELERATRAAPHEAVAADLASVREVRRQIRVLQKWPRDVPAHLALGRCYFDLGLGADAEMTFRHTLTLAPDEPAALYFLALEYAFRGERAVAEDYYARARALVPDLPPFADCLGERVVTGTGDTRVITGVAATR